MVKKTGFDTEKPKEQVKKETLQYFKQQGFKLTQNESNFLQFERGSVLRNTYTFNPLKWKSIISISLKGKRVKAHFDINTIYQDVIKEEEHLWDKFILNYKETIVKGQALVAENEKTTMKTKKAAFKHISHLLLGEIMIGFIVTIVIYSVYSGRLDLFVYIAVIIGLIYLFRKKIK